MHFHKILMPTDFSACANAALTHAIFLAERFDAELHLLHVTVMFEDGEERSGHDFPDVEEIFSRLEEISASEMRGLLTEDAHDRLRIREVQRRAFAAAPAIVEYASDEAMDLIVLGAHGRRGLRRFLLGSVSEEVVQTAPCPVLTLREERPLERLETLVVPFDFSTPSKEALVTAKELAATFDGSIYLVHVIAPAMDEAYGPLHDRRTDYAYATIAREVENRLGSLADEAGGPDVETTIKVLEGQPASVITDFAADVEADLIVLATQGTSGLRHLLLGSVAERVVRAADCPVLTLRDVAAASK